MLIFRVDEPRPGNNNLAIALVAHTVNASLAIAMRGENSLRKMLFESVGASNVVIADEIIANAPVSKLTTRVEVATWKVGVAT
ncbi:hypothetical protein BN2475_640101 [Paraburkholderia ribeironis]|uniref:Uncharacterized protein n=1 Tax=Paraburkholderia ribeironis TaxID=1247936 RepID=A0A1N7SGC0_9BURK|nr:hypothetical protein [Paraburkholderia ribeironis]SIT46448.1 hypothetical protein BN2475_640101 [Paraburkholderia ribeironis]